MPLFRFRLQALLDKRIEERSRAEEIVVDRQKELEVEQQTLVKLKDDVNRVAELYRSKRLALLGSESIGGAQVGRRSGYLAGLKLDLQAAQSGVLSQELFVDQAKDAVGEAQSQLAICRQKVDVLEKFREKAALRFQSEAAYQEELEQDEIGNVMYSSRSSAK